MDIVLHAIAEPRRRDILSLVHEAELTSGEIAARFPQVTPPAISQHLKVLAEAGLVSVRRQGTRRLYRARPEGLAEVRRYLEAFWDDSLQQLKAAAEAEERLSTAAQPAEPALPAAAPAPAETAAATGPAFKPPAAPRFWKGSGAR